MVSSGGRELRGQGMDGTRLFQGGENTEDVWAEAIAASSELGAEGQERCGRGTRRSYSRNGTRLTWKREKISGEGEGKPPTILRGGGVILKVFLRGCQINK